MTTHLVILHAKWLDQILAGDKVIELRASDRRIAPWGKVSRGDRLILKESGGPIRAVAYAQSVASFEYPTREQLADVVDLDSLDPEWWARLTTQRYVTLIEVTDAWALRDPVPWPRRSQSGWDVLDSPAAAAMWSLVKPQWVR